MKRRFSLLLAASLLALTACGSIETSACSAWRQSAPYETKKALPYFEKLVEEKPLLKYVLDDLNKWIENVEKKQNGELTKWEEVTYWGPFDRVEMFCGKTEEEIADENDLRYFGYERE